MAPNPNLQRLHEAGVSIWLDTLSRQLLDSGEFAELIRDYCVTGATSNPTIFAKAITVRTATTTSCASWSSAGERIRRSCSSRSRSTTSARPPALLRPPHTSTAAGSDGFISFECTPDLADDTEATIAQAIDLWQRLDQPNVMIKVPGTEAGLPAIEELTRRGVNINVTLLFSIERYEQVIDAYLRGLTARADGGRAARAIASVASFFLSRIDTKVDAQLPRTRRCAAASRSPAPASPTSATWPSSPGPSGSASSAWAPAPAAAVGEHRHQEPRLLRRALRLRADRPRRGQHDARADAARVRRPRRGRAHARRRPGEAAERTLADAPRRDRSRRASPPSSSARACGRSATPTTSCATASRASSRRWRASAVSWTTSRCSSISSGRFCSSRGSCWQEPRSRRRAVAVSRRRSRCC